MAQGWNFIGGYTGYAAFGNVAFFGIGAYTTGLLMLSKWHLSFFPALAAGALSRRSWRRSWGSRCCA